MRTVEAGVKVRGAPRTEVPFDDEMAPTVWASAGQLTLDWPADDRSQEGWSREDLPPDGWPPGDGAPGDGGPGAGGPGAGALQPEPRRDSPGEGSHEPAGRSAVRRSVVAGASADAKLAVRRFVRLCVEVLNGHRPPAHLRPWSRPGEAAEVVAQALVGARRIADSRRRHRPPRRPPPVAVIRLRLCEPRPGAVEAAVALVTGERTWALALRLELHQDTWSATTLRLI